MATWHGEPYPGAFKEYQEQFSNSIKEANEKITIKTITYNHQFTTNTIEGIEEEHLSVQEMMDKILFNQMVAEAQKQLHRAYSLPPKFLGDGPNPKAQKKPKPTKPVKPSVFKWSPTLFVDVKSWSIEPEEKDVGISASNVPCPSPTIGDIKFYVDKNNFLTYNGTSWADLYSSLTTA